MAVKKYYKTFDGKTIEAIQDAEQISPAEESALRNALGGNFTEVDSTSVQKSSEDISKQVPTQKSVFTGTGRFRGADYKSGVTSNSFRFRFGNTNNFKERINFLEKNVGSKGYVVDKLGDFLLTPEGQEAIGIESNNNLLAIDATGVEGEDIIDLAGEVLAPVIGSIAGFTTAARVIPKTILGKALVRHPFGAVLSSLVFPSIASGGGAYISAWIDEAQQWARGISEESLKDVNKRGKTEALYAAGGDLVFGGIFRLAGRWIAGKGVPRKHLEAFYGEGAIDPSSDAYKKIWSKYDETGELIPQEGSLLYDINKDILPDIYSKQGLDMNLKHRLTLMAENIVGIREAKLGKNVGVFKKLIREALGTTEEGVEILKKPKIDQYITKSIEDAFNTSTDDFIKLSTDYSTKVQANIRGALAILLKASQEGTEGGAKTMDEVAAAFNQLQDGIAMGTTENIIVGERIARQGFKRIKDIFEPVAPVQGTVKGTKKTTTPIELNEHGLTPKQAKELDKINNADVLTPQQQIANMDEMLEKNVEKGLINSVEDPSPTQAFLNGEFDEITEVAIDVVDSLPSGSLKAIDDEIVRLEGISGLGAQDANRLNYLKGIREQEGLSIITDKKGLPIFALRYSETGGPQFINTNNTLEVLKKLKKQDPAMFNKIEPGILKTLSESLDPKSGVQPLTLISPLQHNELVQTLRKVVVDENIDLGQAWTAAIKDGEISYAALGSAMQTVKKKGFKGIKKGSEEYKDKIKTLESLEDFGYRSQKLVDEQRQSFEMFEEFGLGLLAQGVAKRKFASQVLIDRLLSTSSTGPENIETIAKYFDRVTRRPDRAMAQAVETAEEVLPDYAKAIDETVPTLQTEVPPFTMADKAQRIAIEATEELVEEGDQLAKQAMEGGRPGKRVGYEREVQKVTELSPEVTVQSFKATLVDNLFEKISSNKTMSEFADSIREYASNGKLLGGEAGKGPSTLEILLGKEARDELVAISNAIKEVPVEMTDDTGRAIKELFEKGFTELDEGLGAISITGKQGVEELKSLIKKYSNEVTQLRKIQGQKFAKEIRLKNFKLDNDVDIAKFVNTMFDGDAFSTQQLKSVMDNLTGPQRQVIREKYFQKEMRRALGLKSDVLDHSSVDEIAEIFNAGFMDTLTNDPKRFEIIFGAESAEKFRRIFRQGKRIQWQSKTGDYGRLIAAAIAAGFAALPVAIATGSVGIGAGAFMFARFGGIKLYAAAMSDPKVLKAIAEPRFFTPGALNTSEKITLYQNGIMDAVTQMITDTGDVADKTLQAGQNRLQEKSPGGLGAVLKPITSLNWIKPGPQSREALGDLLPSVPKKQSYTPLPVVQDFRQSEDIFSEVNRRRALAGKNPNTQALVDRGR